MSFKGVVVFLFVCCFVFLGGSLAAILYIGPEPFG